MDSRVLEGQLRQFEDLLQQISDALDHATQAKVEELIRILMELHGSGLERMLDIVWESGPQGKDIIEHLLAQDPVASGLLLLHGLHPLGLETRVGQALEKVRPYMHTHGGDVAFLGVTEEGVIQLRLDGTCHGCPSSRITLKFAVEKAIYELAPDAAGIEVVGDNQDPPTLKDSQRKPFGEEGWEEVQGLTTLKTGTTRILSVSDKPLLFCLIDNAYYAYDSLCPKCGELLGLARLTGKELTCARCNHHFDLLRAGRDLDDPEFHLTPFPLLEEEGRVKVALVRYQ
jgi:Fe-S cluster biogenesis protein NfuA/nitrite reductase/ring-hydroxylating ferredoxin subunit